MSLPNITIQKVSNDPELFYYEIYVDDICISDRAVDAKVFLSPGNPPAVQITIEAQKVFFDNGDSQLSASTPIPDESISA